MKNCLSYVLLVWISQPFFLNAEIILQRPSQDEIVCAKAPELRQFLELPQAERRTYFSDREKRKKLRELRDAQPYLFQWFCSEGETGTFTIMISDRDDFSSSSSAWVLPSKQLDRPRSPSP